MGSLRALFQILYDIWAEIFLSMHLSNIKRDNFFLESFISLKLTNHANLNSVTCEKGKYLDKYFVPQNANPEAAFQIEISWQKLEITIQDVANLCEYTWRSKCQVI